MEYAIEEDRIMEINELRNRRKGELLDVWRARVDMVEEGGMEMSYIDDDGGGGGVVDEILSNDDARYAKDDEARVRKDELDGYYETRMSERLEDVDYDEYGIAAAAGGDFDDVYERSLDELRASRSDRLGSRTLGVLSNSIALEDGREYVRRAKRARKFLIDVERELSNELLGGGGDGDGGVVSDEDVAVFFRRPSTLEEERMYRSIIRKIVD